MIQKFCHYGKLNSWSLYRMQNHICIRIKKLSWSTLTGFNKNTGNFFMNSHYCFEFPILHEINAKKYLLTYFLYFPYIFRDNPSYSTICTYVVRERERRGWLAFNNFFQLSTLQITCSQHCEKKKVKCHNLYFSQCLKYFGKRKFCQKSTL